MMICNEMNIIIRDSSEKYDLVRVSLVELFVKVHNEKVEFSKSA